MVHAHPEPASFCSAQMRDAAQALQAQGCTVEISDLHAMNGNPVLGRHDFRHELTGHFKPQAEQVKAIQQGTFAPDVAAEIDKVLRADLLVFFFPMWWFSLPALLKGWVDRVLAMGAAYGGRFESGDFRGRQATLLFTTGSPADMFGPGARDGELDVILFHIRHGLFHFVGSSVLAPVVSFSPVRHMPQERAAQLRPGPEGREGFGTRPVLTWTTGAGA